MAKMNKKEFDDQVKSQQQMLELSIEIEKASMKQLNWIQKAFDVESQRKLALLEISEAENKRNIRAQEYAKMLEQVNTNQIEVSKKTLNTIQKQIVAETIQIKKQKEKLALTDKWGLSLGRALSTTMRLGGALADLVGSIGDMDKPMREAVLNLGLGSDRAEGIKNAFYDATPAAIALGGSMGDLRDIQTEYAEATNRTVGLTAQELINVEKIARGTNLGATAAGKLVGEFATLGKDIGQTTEMVQGIVDASERMGINSNKVIKNLSQNFTKLNTFAFKNGVDGMKKLSLYAEKYKVDMGSVLDTAQEFGHSLDKTVEATATLNTLGGEFAKTDAFEMFNLSRNDPAKFTQKINEMTKGMASLVKTADGFEMQISPNDLDRMKVAADALGVPFENMVEQAKQFGHYQKMNNSLMGKGFTKDQIEAIHSMAKLDGKSGIYQVMGKNIADLSKEEAENLIKQQTTLEERAKAAQSFDEKWNNTITLLKSSLLPLLEGANLLMEGIMPIVKWFSEGIHTLMKISPSTTKGFGMFLAGALVLKGLRKTTIGNMIASKIGIGGAKKGAADAAGDAIGKGGGGSAGGGLSALGKGAGVGVAAAGIGAGIGLAAVGISKLADSMAKLDSTQIWALPATVLALGVAVAAFTIPLAFLGPVLSVSAVGLAAFGLAALGIGAGIGLAALGIGEMAKGFSTLKDVDLLSIALGLGAIGLAMSSFAIGGISSLLIGGGALGMILAIASQADNLTKVGNSFKEIGVVMNGSADQFERVEKAISSIANAKSNSNGIFADLIELLSKPLKVEFKDKNVALNVNTTIQVDSNILAKVTAKKIIVLHNDYQNGKAG